MDRLIGILIYYDFSSRMFLQPVLVKDSIIDGCVFKMFNIRLGMN